MDLGWLYWFFFLLIGLVISMTVFLKSAPHIPLLLAAVLAGRYRFLSSFFLETNAGGGSQAPLPPLSPSLLIILSIGILIAAWMAGGIIPAMVYYGLQILSPRFFLVTTLLLCSIVFCSHWKLPFHYRHSRSRPFRDWKPPLGFLPPSRRVLSYPAPTLGIKCPLFRIRPTSPPSVSGANLFDHIRHMMVTHNAYIHPVHPYIWNHRSAVWKQYSQYGSDCPHPFPRWKNTFFIHPPASDSRCTGPCNGNLSDTRSAGPFWGAAALGILSAVFSAGSACSKPFPRL